MHKFDKIILCTTIVVLSAIAGFVLIGCLFLKPAWPLWARIAGCAFTAVPAWMTWEVWKMLREELRLERAVEGLARAISRKTGGDK